MGRDASISLDWADGTYSFRLAWGELILLQEECNAGPYLVQQRIADGSWRVQDISSVIRLGLIGGGMEPDKALTMVRNYVEARPPIENLQLAQGILSSAIMGVPDETPGEPEKADQKTV